MEIFIALLSALQLLALLQIDYYRSTYIATTSGILDLLLFQLYAQESNAQYTRNNCYARHTDMRIALLQKD